MPEEQPVISIVRLSIVVAHGTYYSESVHKHPCHRRDAKHAEKFFNENS